MSSASKEKEQQGEKGESVSVEIVERTQQEGETVVENNSHLHSSNESAAAGSADSVTGTKRQLNTRPNGEEQEDGGGENNTAENAETGDDGHPNKKAKSEEQQQPGNNNKAVRTIPGFDLPMDTSSTTIPPSNEGTTVFNEYDVLSGRGGGTNVHFGNRAFRDIINRYREIYLKSKKNDKPSISRAIVKEVRSKGGRFLKKNEKNQLYYEIGDAQAREKTSQALRQRAPEIRKLMFEQQQMGAPGSGITNLMGGMGVLPSQLQPLNGTAPTPTAPSDAGPAQSSIPNNGNARADEQFRMAMPIFNLNGMHPNFAAGLQAGMEFHQHAMMGGGAATAAAAGHLMGAANGYNNPAFYQAMMAGMGATGGMGAGGSNNGGAAASGTDVSQSGEEGAANQRQQQQQQQQHMSNQQHYSP